MFLCVSSDPNRRTLITSLSPSTRVDPGRNAVLISTSACRSSLRPAGLAILTGVAGVHTVPEADQSPSIEGSTTHAHEDEGPNIAANAPCLPEHSSSAVLYTMSFPLCAAADRSSGSSHSSGSRVRDPAGTIEAKVRCQHADRLGRAAHPPGHAAPRPGAPYTWKCGSLVRGHQRARSAHVGASSVRRHVRCFCLAPHQRRPSQQPDMT